MGSTFSRSATESEGNDKGFFLAFLLCGGSDAVDEKAGERYAARRQPKSVSETKDPKPTDCQTVRVQQSANLFLREFKIMLQKQGLAAYKYSRSGRSSSVAASGSLFCCMLHDSSKLTFVLTKVARLSTQPG